MTEEAKKAKREYERKWRAENKDRVKAIRERYWARRAARGEQNEQTKDN